MAWLLIAACLAVLLCAWLAAAWERCHGAVWWAWLPATLATALVLAVLAWPGGVCAER